MSVVAGVDVHFDGNFAGIRSHIASAVRGKTSRARRRLPISISVLKAHSGGGGIELLCTTEPIGDIENAEASDSRCKDDDDDDAFLIPKQRAGSDRT